MSHSILIKMRKKKLFYSPAMYLSADIIKRKIDDENCVIDVDIM